MEKEVVGSMKASLVFEKSPFHQQVVNYWDERSSTYSNSIKDELCDFHFEAWDKALMSRIPMSEVCSYSQENSIKVLDLGCGPGFFEILLSNNGCIVDAVDCSESMLEKARENVLSSGNPELVNYYCCDVGNLPFSDSSYDVIVSRNVTWLMSAPVEAYAEWQRVLKPGGKLLVFDANWYSYLADESLNRTRIDNQVDSSILEWSECSFATESQERRCEKIALNLPLTYENRPAWDLQVLDSLGFVGVKVDEDFSRYVWNEGEQLFYATSPLFSVEATKDCTVNC